MAKIASSKSVISSSFPELVIDDKTLKKLQSVLLAILKDLDFVCKKHGLEYMLCGGTLLGAVRHKGFIPWDDDVDVMMKEESYLELPEAFAAEFPDKYLVRPEMTSKYDPTCCMKIYLKGTEYVELLSENWKKPQMIFLDIFCIKDVPDSKLRRKIKGYKYDIAARCAALKIERKYTSDTVKAKMKTDKVFARYIKKRRRLGVVASLLPVKWWYAIAKRQVKYKNPKCKYLGIPSGIRYNREILPREVYSSTVEVEFEGKFFPAPIGYDSYLTNLYGDYMQIPPEEKRERHIAVKLEFN